MQVDLAAVARIARRVDLRDLRLVEISASLTPGEIQLLEPDITFACSGDRPTPTTIVALCGYQFIAKSGGATVAEVNAQYVMSYELMEELEITDSDLQQFAQANGVYHSWPFLRQLLFDLTAKMGLPPFTLPVFKVLPRATKAEAPQGQITEPKVAPKSLPRKAKKTKKRAAPKAV